MRKDIFKGTTFVFFAKPVQARKCTKDWVICLVHFATGWCKLRMELLTLTIYFLDFHQFLKKSNLSVWGLFDLYLLSSDHRPGASCMLCLWMARTQSLGNLMAQDLLNHLTYFVCCKKKSLFCLRVTFFITVQLLRDGRWKSTLK